MVLHRVISLKVVKLEVWKTAWFQLHVHDVFQQISRFSLCIKMEGTSFNEFFLPSKLENNDLNDKVDVLSNPHILVKNINTV